ERVALHASRTVAGLEVIVTNADVQRRAAKRPLILTVDGDVRIQPGQVPHGREEGDGCRRTVAQGEGITAVPLLQRVPVAEIVVESELEHVAAGHITRRGANLVVHAAGEDAI